MQDEDVTKLTDEELQAKVNGEEPEETEKEVAESADSEEAPSEEKEEAKEPETQEEPEEPQTEEPEAKQPEEEQKPPSRRETLRIQQILAKREKAQEAPQQPSQPRQDVLNYQEALDADPAVIQQLEADRRANGESQYNRGLQQAQQLAEARSVASEFRTNIKLDYPLVKSKLDKLDPADVEALDIEYLQITGYDTETGLVSNPNIGYAEYVEARYEQAQRLASSMTAETTKNIAKQAAQTGLRPDGSSAKTLNLNKNPENMTDEELYAYLNKQGIATPK